MASFFKIKPFKNWPIKSKVTGVVLFANITALAITVTAFIAYDLATFKQNLVRNLSVVSSLVAQNSSAALIYEYEKEAQESLNSLRANPDILSGAFYDRRGRLFVRYPETEPLSSFPARPGETGAVFQDKYLIVFQPVEEGKTRLGTFYVKSSTESVRRRMKLHAEITSLVFIGAMLVALGISNAMQRRITHPILALAESAKAVSEHGDYSVRPVRQGQDELGLLTDAFNQMLTRIQEQTVALRENEERLRLALEASRTAAWNWDIRSDRIFWGEQLHRLHGLQPGEFRGNRQHLRELIHPDDRASFETAVEQALAKKEHFMAEYRVRWPDGSTHFLLSRGSAFYSQDGKASTMTGVTLDVTQERRAEETQALMASIVQSSDDAIVGKDMQSRVVSWNAGAERMFGYSQAEMLGQPVTRLISPDRPGEETLVMEDVKLGKVRHFETVRVHKDGRKIEVSLTISPIHSASGEIVGVSSIARDVTERKRSQEALERHAAVLREQAQMLELTNVMARDLQDRIILWNRGMERLYGYSKAEALGKNSHELFRTKFSQPLAAIQKRLFETGVWEGELTHMTKDRRMLQVFSQWALHRDKDGKPVAILEVANDITARKTAEQEVIRMNAELEQRVNDRTAELLNANHEMEAFTYSVAHDLRAPLRHVDAFSRIVLEDFGSQLPEEGKNYLEHIRRGSRNMSQLVDDLLNLARVGRQEIKRSPAPLTPIVDQVVRELDHEINGRKITWKIHPLPEPDCDGGLMKQVFANLLSNAVKYTRPRENAVIEVGVQRANGQPAIFVRDNGVGFNMKYADKLFGVFQRLHRAEDFEGTGIGLATVQRIIRKHGGSVWAQSEVDQGATFYFTLPGLSGPGAHA
jgi:PAS domain S-box-containing protein